MHIIALSLVVATAVAAANTATTSTLSASGSPDLYVIPDSQYEIEQGLVEQVAPPPAISLPAEARPYVVHFFDRVKTYANTYLERHEVDDEVAEFLREIVSECADRGIEIFDTQEVENQRYEEMMDSIHKDVHEHHEEEARAKKANDEMADRRREQRRREKKMATEESSGSADEVITNDESDAYSGPGSRSYCGDGPSRVSRIGPRFFRSGLNRIWTMDDERRYQRLRVSGLSSVGWLKGPGSKEDSKDFTSVTNSDNSKSPTSAPAELHILAKREKNITKPKALLSSKATKTQTQKPRVTTTKTIMAAMLHTPPPAPQPKTQAKYTQSKTTQPKATQRKTTQTTITQPKTARPTTAQTAKQAVKTTKNQQTHTKRMTTTASTPATITSTTSQLVKAVIRTTSKRSELAKADHSFTSNDRVVPNGGYRNNRPHSPTTASSSSTSVKTLSPYENNDGRLDRYTGGHGPHNSDGDGGGKPKNYGDSGLPRVGHGHPKYIEPEIDDEGELIKVPPKKKERAGSIELWSLRNYKGHRAVYGEDINKCHTIDTLTHHYHGFGKSAQPLWDNICCLLYTVRGCNGYSMMIAGPVSSLASYDMDNKVRSVKCMDMESCNAYLLDDKI